MLFKRGFFFFFFSVHWGVDEKGGLEHREGVYAGEREIRGKGVLELTVSPLSNAFPL